MEANEYALRDWMMAAFGQFGVDCIADFHVQGQWFPIHLPHFGGPQGMVVAGLGRKRVDVRPYYLSLVNADLYCSAQYSSLCEALNDWGWFGPLDRRPAWFAGHSYVIGGIESLPKSPAV